MTTFTTAEIASSPTFALFDLDGCLIPLDSDHEFGLYTVEQGWHDPDEFNAANDRFYEDYKAKRLDIHEYVRFATQGMREQGTEQAEAVRAGFMRDIILPKITPAARALVMRHQEQGHEVAIVTSTNEFVTRPIADAFGIDTLIATELETDKAGLPTGEIKGTPTLQEGKVTRVNEYLAERGLSLNDVVSYFYSDSSNDLPLLKEVTHAIATNPDAELEAEARARNWQILRLFA